MRILATNDDGINSIGLHMLVKEMEKDNEVIVVAPSSQRSASGHSITIHRPLIVKEVKIEGIKAKCYSVDGTPADCVKVALDMLVDEKIDMVISGTNRGYNLGTDVLYSGTVSAAIEGAINKIPSVAISTDFTDKPEHYTIAAEYAREVIVKSWNRGIKNDVVLNVNVPVLDEGEIKGIKVCSLGNRTYTNVYIETLTEENEKGYKLHGEVNDGEEEGTDVSYIREGFVTVTPLHYDLTNFKILRDVKAWF